MEIVGIDVEKLYNKAKPGYLFALIAEFPIREALGGAKWTMNGLTGT